MNNGNINVLEDSIDNYCNRFEDKSPSDFILSRNSDDSKKPMKYKGLSIGVFDVEDSDIRQHTINKLERKNVKVINIPDEGDSDGLDDHAGESDESLELVMKNIEAYEKHAFDYIINSTDGSGANLKEYYKLFVPGTNWYHRARGFSDRVIEGSEIMKTID